MDSGQWTVESEDVRILPVSEASLAEAVHIIHDGGVVAHPTETCYGLACDLTNPGAVAKLFELKQRPLDQPVSALFANLEEVKKYVEWKAVAEDLARKYLPGPLTTVLPLKKDAPSALFPVPPRATSSVQRTTVGIRLSSHPVAQRLATLVSLPLSTTSANLHGQPEPYSVEEILEQFRDRDLQPDLVLDGRTLPYAPPSTVVEVRGDSLAVLRQGGIALSS